MLLLILFCATELPALVSSSSSGMNFQQATVLSLADWKETQCRLDKRLIEAEKTWKAQEDEGTVESQKAQ